MTITSVLESALDLSLADVIQNTETQFLVVSMITPVRMILAGLSGAVALYFLWQIKSDFAEVSWFSLFPGVVIAPVFAIISIVFFFAHHEKNFLIKERRAVVQGSMFGLSARREYVMPMNGRVSIMLRKTLNRTDTHSLQYQYHYDVTVDALPAMGFTVSGDRPRAQEFAKNLARALGYEMADRSEDLSK
ncbi:hypothetical protein BH11PSE12_BH11PSE12_34530 [soil metagenome]